MSDDVGRRDDGFEFRGEFFRWSVSAIGKDLMLIDRFSGLPVADFFDVVEDAFDRGRAPVMLTLIATSMRAAHPEWSVERIVRIVMDLSLDEVTFIAGDAPEEDATADRPPDSEDETPTGANSSSALKSLPSVGTSEPETYETFSATHG